MQGSNPCPLHQLRGYMKHRLIISDLICGEIVEESYDFALLYKLAKYMGARLFSIEPIGENDDYSYSGCGQN